MQNQSAEGHNNQRKQQSSNTRQMLLTSSLALVKSVSPAPTPRTCASIDGLTLLDNFITPAEHDELLAFFNQQEWHSTSASTLTRRVQQYGFQYQYDRKHSTPQQTTAIPGICAPLLQRLADRRVFVPRAPDQLIVNEYKPGQGIAAHVDHTVHFGGVVASLTLGSHCVMTLTALDKKTSHDILLEPRSLLVLSGDARYQWSHSIGKLKSDTLPDGRTLRRGTRVSLTFRTMASRAAEKAPS